MTALKTMLLLGVAVATGFVIPRFLRYLSNAFEQLAEETQWQMLGILTVVMASFVTTALLALCCDDFRGSTISREDKVLSILTLAVAFGILVLEIRTIPTIEYQYDLGPRVLILWGGAYAVATSGFRILFTEVKVAKIHTTR